MIQVVGKRPTKIHGILVYYTPTLKNGYQSEFSRAFETISKRAQKGEIGFISIQCWNYRGDLIPRYYCGTAVLPPASTAVLLFF
jgi:hypothetical protein